MNEEKPLFSISDTDGIETNLKKGDSLITNSTTTYMQGVKHNVDGGVLEHHATEELTQIGNTMEAINGGKILNEVGSDGKLNQIGNKMRADSGGLITNKVSKKVKTVAWIVVIGVLADVISVTTFGFHLWEKVGSYF